MQFDPLSRHAAAPSEQILRGRAAVITGSTSGIGLGIAQKLAAAGANIMFNGFKTGSDIDQIRNSLEVAAGIQTAYSDADMSNPDEIAAMIDAARSAFGQIDILINNAGVQHVEAIESFPVAKWNDIIAIDLSAAFHTIRAVVPEMKQRGWGRIISIASAHGLVASPFKSAYVAAKHGIVGLTKAVALELAEHGITVNAICPGYVLTPLVEKQIPETARARMLSEEQVIHDVILHAQPTHKFVTTGEVGALSLFLCQDSARSITGAALPIEGGWTAQ